MWCIQTHTHTHAHTEKEECYSAIKKKEILGGTNYWIGQKVRLVTEYVVQ